MISFGRKICSDYSAASQREWLETNGTGGYALSTVCLSTTRRHQGLLVAAQGSSKKRYVLLNRLEEKIIGPGWSHSISCQQYEGIVAPQGHNLLERFSLNPFPEFTYLVEDARIKKTFFLFPARIPPS